jgi:hypothetical protein
MFLASPLPRSTLPCLNADSRQNGKNIIDGMKRRIKCMLHRFMRKCWAWYVIGNSTQVIQMDTKRSLPSPPPPSACSKVANCRRSWFMLDMLPSISSTLNFQIRISATSPATAPNINGALPIQSKSKSVNHDLIECVILNIKLISSAYFPGFCIT